MTEETTKSSTSDSSTTDAGRSKQESQPPSVRTRRVHYVSGFDPRGPRYYHRLYREESALQSKLSSARHEIGPRRNLGSFLSAWQITSDWGDERVETDYQFMGWDDIVRQKWDSNRQLLTRSLPVYLKYIFIGGFHQVARASRNAFISSVYPIWYLVGFALIILLAGLVAGGLTFFLTGHKALAVPIAMLAWGLLAWTGYRRAHRKGILWLLRTCIFVVHWGSRPIPEIDRRVSEMADHILNEQAKNPVDEVLIIGHSIGTMLSLSLVARILERESKADLSPYQFVTMGQCIPYLGVMPGAKSFRQDIATVSADDRIPWTDFTAPPDPLCFFKINPARACGLSHALNNRPKQFIVRIFRMFSPISYSRIRRDKLRIHFQYLMASELPSDYDYFKITTGPRSMREYSGGS